MNFVMITREEFDALYQFRHDGWVMFLWIKSVVDYATGIAGIKTRINERMLLESTEQQLRGKGIERLHRAAIYRILDGLESRGVIKNHGNLVFSFPLDTGLNPSKNKPDTTRTQKTAKTGLGNGQQEASEYTALETETGLETGHNPDTKSCLNRTTSTPTNISLSSPRAREENVVQFGIPTPKHLAHLFGKSIPLETVYEAMLLLGSVDTFWGDKFAAWGESAEMKIRRMISQCFTAMPPDGGVMQALNLLASQQFPEAFAVEEVNHHEQRSSKRTGQIRRGQTEEELAAVRAIEELPEDYDFSHLFENVV